MSSEDTCKGHGLPTGEDEVVEHVLTRHLEVHLDEVRGAATQVGVV